MYHLAGSGNRPAGGLHRVTLIPGDGIGPEVMSIARRVIEASGARIDWDVQEAGIAAVGRAGTTLPASVIESIQASRVALKGPTATGTNGERSVSVRLREQLDLYAGVRTCRALPGSLARFPGTNLVIIRMTHEDLYAGIEFAARDPEAGVIRDLARSAGRPRISVDAAISLKPLSSRAIGRLVDFAYRWATAAGRRRVTIVHKATVMRATDGLFRSIALERARDHPGLAVDEILVDSACLELVRHPERFDVLVLPVQYGDIVSDLAAGLVGGLGVAPGVNVGDDAAVFEAVHGTAPRLAGRDRANPLAAVLTGAMLLRHLGEREAAERIELAVDELLKRGHPLTYDLLDCPDDDRRAGSTTAVGQALVDALARGHASPSLALPGAP